MQIVTIDTTGALVSPGNPQISQIPDLSHMVNLGLVHDNSIFKLQAQMLAATALINSQATTIAKLQSSIAALSNTTTITVGGTNTGTGSTVTNPTPVPVGTPVTIPAGWTTLTLSPADNIGAALTQAARGFKLLLAPGYYPQVFNVPSGLDGWEITSSTGKAADVVIDGQGGLTVAQNNTGQGPTRLAWGKGVIHANSPGHVHDIEVTGGGWKATDGHDGQAGVYWECSNGDCRLTRVMVRHNQNGVFGNNNNNNVNYIFDSCDFINNSVDGGSHDSYVNGNNSTLTIINCHCPGSNFGNNFKTRVSKVTMRGGWYGSKGANRWIEAADGAVMDIQGGVYIANDYGQNVFGNGTESTNQGPGITTMAGSILYIGNRSANFSNAGSFNATGVTIYWEGQGGSIFNDKGQALNGLPTGPAGTYTAFPSDPGMVSGAH